MFYSKPILITAILLIISSACMLSGGPALADEIAENALVVEDKGLWEEAVGVDGEAVFKWELTNEANMSLNVRVIVTETDEGWAVEVDGARQFVLHPGAANSTRVTVRARPLSEDAPEKERITVLFSASAGGSKVIDVQKTFHVQRREGRLVFGVFENPLPAPLNGRFGDFLLSLVIWVVIVIVAIVLLGKVIKRITGKTRIKLDDLIVRAIRVPLLLGLILYGTVSSLELLAIPEGIMVWLRTTYNIILIILVMYAVIKTLSALVQAGVRLSRKMNEPGVSNMLLPMTKKLGTAVVFIVGLFAILAQVGLDITFFVTSMGVVGILVAFSAQDTLSNIFSGLHLLLDQSFKIGDRILLPEKLGRLYSAWGDVLHIGLRSTKVRSTDGVILTIPNKMITQNYLANFSHLQDPSLRVRIRIGLVPKWPNVEKAMRTAERLANEHPDVLDKPRKPQVVLREFGASNILMELRFYVKSPRAMRTTKSDLLQAILRMYDEEGIVISTPLSYSIESNLDPAAMGYPELSEHMVKKPGKKGSGKGSKAGIRGKG